MGFYVRGWPRIISFVGLLENQWLLSPQAVLGDPFLLQQFLTERHFILLGTKPCSWWSLTKCGPKHTCLVVFHGEFCVPLWLTSFWPVSALPVEELEPQGMTWSTCCLANVVARQLGPSSLFPWHKRLSESFCCMLSSLKTGKNSFLFVEDAIHKVRPLPWCPMCLLTIALCSRVERKPWGTPQTAAGAWHGLCLCCHRLSLPFATGNGSRRCSRG